MKLIKIKINISYILLFFSYLKFYAKCYTCEEDCKRVNNICQFKKSGITGNFCYQNCRPNLLNLNSEKCYSCGSISEQQYYYFTNDISGTCTPLDRECSALNVHILQIYESFQCVASCGVYLYELGKYCYINCLGGNREEEDSSINKCKCRYLYKVVNSEYKCFDQNEYCDPTDTYYDYESGLCSTSGCGSKKKYTFKREGNRPITRCSNTCLEGEYLDNEGNCLTSCIKFFYTDRQTKEKRCVTSCPNSPYPMIADGNECRYKDECKYYNNGIEGLGSCLTSCGNYYITKISTSSSLLYCSQNCVYPTQYRSYIETDKVCLESCPSNFYESSDPYKCTTVNTAKTCYYSGSGSNTKSCDTGCNYQYYGRYKCEGCDNVGGTFPYYTYNNNNCYESCDLINGFTKNYIINGNVCECVIYGMVGGNKVCFNNEEDCYINGGFRYIRGNQCLNEDDAGCIYKVDGDNAALKKCFETTDECASKGYHYYNNIDKKCWASCPDHMYANALTASNKPGESNGNTCSNNCEAPYSYHSTNSHICKLNCDTGEYRNTTTNECLFSCPLPNFVGEKDECLTECKYPNFTITYNDASKNKKCVTKCIIYGKYYDAEDNTRTCKDECPAGKFYNSENQILETCTSINNSMPAEIYDYANPALTVYPCLTYTDIAKLYYYNENNKKMYAKCDIYDTSGTRTICTYCNATNKYVYKNYCVNECPFEAPYFRDIEKNFSLTDNEKTHIKYCLTKCEINEYIVEYTNECVTNCPENHFLNTTLKKCFISCASNKYFDPILNKCVDSCSDYYEKSIISNNNICKKSCSARNKYINGKECVSSCTGINIYVGLNNVCKSSCTASDGLYQLHIDSMIKCLFSCPAVVYIYYVKGNFTCYDKCPPNPDYYVIETTENNYECRTSCPYDYPYYPSSKNTKNYFACSKTFPCSDNQYFYNGNCIASCKDILGSKVQRRICVSSCNSTDGYIYTKKIENNAVTECKKYCDNNEYIIGNDGRVCYDNCPSGNPYIGNNRNCFANCTASGVGNKFYLFSNSSGYEIFKCVESCPLNLPLLDKATNRCVDACKSTQFLSSEENACYNNNCLTSGVNKFTLDYGNPKKCWYKCDDTSTNKFYYNVIPPSTYTNIYKFKCLSKCYNNDYALETTNICIIGNCPIGYYKYSSTSTTQQYYCVTKCPSDKPFIDSSNNCVDKCTSPNIYYVREFIHSETDIQRRCLNDCPKEYKYYEEINGFKECFSTCDKGYYVNSDTDKNATRCLPDCPNVSLKYYYKLIDGINKKCVQTCPTTKMYHLPGYGSECIKECPDYAKFHFNGEVVCYNEKGLKDNYNNCNYINYDSKTCYTADVCSSKKKSIHKESGITICLNECIQEYGEYFTPYNTCVKDCVSDLQGQHFINDMQNKNCTCENFYIYNTSGKFKDMECLPNSVGKKKCKYVNSTYNINKFGSQGSRECVKNCIGGIYSPSEDTCYDKAYIKDNQTCSDFVDKNSYYTGTKCECSYNFYYIDEEVGRQKICLEENGECPLEYIKYVHQTKECTKTCATTNYKTIFKDLCLNYTPINSELSGGEQKCKANNYRWYLESGKYVCAAACPSGYLEVPFTSTSILCLGSCLGTHYPYYFNNSCYTSCANNDLLDIVNGFEVPEKPSDANENKANHTCKCLNPWYRYYDTTKKKEIIQCSDSKYPFSISNCKNFTNPKKNFTYMVKHTLECIDSNCPTEYPFYYNNECFKDCENDASSYYHYLARKNQSSHECVCKNLWYFNNITNKSECIEVDINECIKFNFYLKYKINETRQCVSECPSGTWFFNYVCYNKCPENTTENATDHTCSCDTELGYWYRYEKDNGTNYLRCVLDECPKENNETIKHARKNIIEGNSQCVISCSENDTFKYSIRSICRESCPYFTGLNEAKDECVFLDLNDEINITNLTMLKDAANVQTKELYEGSEHLGGFLYNRFNATLHFYATDINNTLANISFKSNLTYIDLNTCIQKIYASNGDYINEDNNTILIAKYDLITNTINDNTAAQISNNDKYLINKVEYELFSSNMSEKLDINETTCDPYELIISYPLTLNRFNNYVGGLNQNEYRKKFEIGKKLHLRDSNIDTFHFNNTVYKDFCRSLEIDGKDLVFEDRYKYLFPNDKIVCESNCIQNNTDFEHERMICLCSLKLDFNISREDDKSIDIYNDPFITLPTQSKYNAEAVKCMFNFSLNETIFYNEAFYYSSIITIVQFSMMFISAFSGVKNMIGNIRHLLSKLNSNRNFGRKNNNTKTKEKTIKFNDNVMSTTNRRLNNPPRKDKVKEKYNEDIDFDSDDGEKNNNNTILEYDLDSNSNSNKDDEGVKYEINIKKVVKPENKEVENENKNKNKNSEFKNKAEYIPPEYNFKFFRPKDKALMKKIERSQIPFEVNPETIYLIERRKGIEYPEDYLDGPYYPEQNLLIITDDKIKDVRKIAKKLKDEKYMKKKTLPNNDNNSITNNKLDEKTIKFDDNKTERKSQKVTVNDKTKTSFYKPKTIGEKSFVSVKKIDPNDISQKEDNTLDELDDINQRKTEDDDTGLFYLIRREHIFLRVNYKTYIKKAHPYYFCVFLAEIFDKIYLFRICLLLRQTDIFSVYFTLYLFCHILLLTLLCNLFSIDIIRKIWERTDFPNLNFFLLYGLIAGLIIWVVYLIFSCLINFEDSVKDISKAKYDAENNDEVINDKYNRKYSCLICQIKFRVSILHILTFLITICCGIYLVAFFALYTGTKSLVLKIYYISIIEIVLIKVVYGIILASLRIVSKEAKLKALYVIIYILDKYLS